MMLETVGGVRSELAQFGRYTAPDVLRARIRSMVATTPSESAAHTESTSEPRGSTSPSRQHWKRVAAFAAVAVLAAALGSGVTRIASRRPSRTETVQSQVLASHLRSLMPNHLTDIASSDQHNVKPWFNGRLDMSPNVPRLDSLGDMSRRPLNQGFTLS